MNSLALHSGIVIYYVTAWTAILPFMLKLSTNTQEDERLTTMRDIGDRYLTMWNFTFQTLVFLGYLICDILEVQQKFTRFHKKFKRVLDGMFYGVIVPVSISISILFWSLYSYNPGMVFIYPHFIGKVLTPWTNHAMHTIIVITSFLQVYHNRASPIKYSVIPLRLMLFCAAYLICLYGTYFQKKIWVYPFLNYLSEPLRLFCMALIMVKLLVVNMVFHRLNELYCNTTIKITKEQVTREEKSH